MKMKFRWEVIHTNAGNTVETSRAKVIGGWIVNNCSAANTNTPSESMVFISDPSHQWEIEQCY